MKRTLKYVHVLTDWERKHYARVYDLPKERFVFIPWPKRLSNDPYPRRIERRDPANLKIVSSGRNACDWETLFKAAKGQNWDLTVICSRRDLHKVRKLNWINVNILCDIPSEEHQKKLEESDIYVLCLIEEDHSCGHIRINNATRFGVPIVATSVKGIDGYIVDGETGLLTPPGNHLALRESINLLLGDIELRKRLVKNAFEWAINQTREIYLDNINELLRLAIRDIKIETDKQ